MKRNRRGFSLIELFVVLVVLGIIARLAVPRYHTMKDRAICAKIIGDVNAIQHAIGSLHADTNGWPSNTGPGSVPPELITYLPAQFTFVKPEYTLELNVAPPPTGSPVDNAIVTVDVTSTDPDLLLLLPFVAQPAMAHYPVPGKYTFVLAGLASS
ncbi:MAG: prepilin-type N-terminal cleavage/methylation domain-containing protein [Gemmatimonadaceae bacterium]